MKRNRFLGLGFHSTLFRSFIVLILLCFLNLTLAPPLLAGPSEASTTATAVFLAAYSNSLSSSDLKKISRSLYRSLKDSTPFQFYDPKEMERRFNSVSSPEAFLGQIDESIGQARMEYFEFRFDRAASILQNSIARAGSFELTPALQSKISDAYLNLGLVFDAQLRHKDAWVAYVNSVALDPAKEPDPARYPPNVITKISKAKTEYLGMKGGVSLETDPSGAKVILEGQELGTTPALFKNLPLGVHPVRLKKEGYGEIERNIFVALASEGNKPTVLQIDLNRKSKSPSLAVLADSLSQKTNYESQISEMALLGNRVGVDQIFSARVEKDDAGAELYLVQVDVAQGKEVGRVYVKGLNLTDLDRQIPSVLSEMQKRKSPEKWTNLIAVGDAKTDFKPEGTKEKKSFFKTWPFFVLVGVVVAGAGAGAAFALKGGGGGGGGAPSSGPVTVTSPSP